MAVHQKHFQMLEMYVLESITKNVAIMDKKKSLKWHLNKKYSGVYTLRDTVIAKP